MPPHPSPLADTVAALRVATLATPAHACVPQAIHALILACLARIFGRLEEMIRLWQSGCTPPPTTRSRTARATSTAGSAQARHRPHDAPNTPCTAQQARNHEEAESQEEAGESTPVSLPLGLFVNCLPSHRRAREAPPSRHRQPAPRRVRRTIAPQPAPSTHAQFVTIS
jgi:hypothetical protein